MYDDDGLDNADTAEVDDAECDALMELTSLASAEVKPKQPHFTAGPEQSANIKQIQIQENTNYTSPDKKSWPTLHFRTAFLVLTKITIFVLGMIN